MPFPNNCPSSAGPARPAARGDRGAARRRARRSAAGERGRAEAGEGGEVPARWRAGAEVRHAGRRSPPRRRQGYRNGPLRRWRHHRGRRPAEAGGLGSGAARRDGRAHPRRRRRPRRVRRDQLQGRRAQLRRLAHGDPGGVRARAHRAAGPAQHPAPGGSESPSDRPRHSRRRHPRSAEPSSTAPPRILASARTAAQFWRRARSAGMAVRSGEAAPPGCSGPSSPRRC